MAELAVKRRDPQEHGGTSKKTACPIFSVVPSFRGPRQFKSSSVSFRPPSGGRPLSVRPLCVLLLHSLNLGAGPSGVHALTVGLFGRYGWPQDSSYDKRVGHSSHENPNSGGSASSTGAHRTGASNNKLGEWTWAGGQWARRERADPESGGGPPPGPHGERLEDELGTRTGACCGGPPEEGLGANVIHQKWASEVASASSRSLVQTLSVGAGDSSSTSASHHGDYLNRNSQNRSVPILTMRNKNCGYPHQQSAAAERQQSGKTAFSVPEKNTQRSNNKINHYVANISDEPPTNNGPPGVGYGMSAPIRGRPGSPGVLGPAASWPVQFLSNFPSGSLFGPGQGVPSNYMQHDLHQPLDQGNAISSGGGGFSQHHALPDVGTSDFSGTPSTSAQGPPAVPGGPARSQRGDPPGGPYYSPGDTASAVRTHNFLAEDPRSMMGPGPEPDLEDAFPGSPFSPFSALARSRSSSLMYTPDSTPGCNLMAAAPACSFSGDTSASGSRQQAEQNFPRKENRTRLRELAGASRAVGGLDPGEPPRTGRSTWRVPMGSSALSPRAYQEEEPGSSNNGQFMGFHLYGSEAEEHNLNSLGSPDSSPVLHGSPDSRNHTWLLRNPGAAVMNGISSVHNNNMNNIDIRRDGAPMNMGAPGPSNTLQFLHPGADNNNSNNDDNNGRYYELFPQNNYHSLADLQTLQNLQSFGPVGSRDPGPVAAGGPLLHPPAGGSVHPSGVGPPDAFGSAGKPFTKNAIGTVFAGRDDVHNNQYSSINSENVKKSQICTPEEVMVPLPRGSDAATRPSSLQALHHMFWERKDDLLQWAHRFQIAYTLFVELECSTSHSPEQQLAALANWPTDFDSWYRILWTFAGLNQRLGGGSEEDGLQHQEYDEVYLKVLQGFDFRLTQNLLFQIITLVFQYAHLRLQNFPEMYKPQRIAGNVAAMALLRASQLARITVGKGARVAWEGGMRLTKFLKNLQTCVEAKRKTPPKKVGKLEELSKRGENTSRENKMGPLETPSTGFSNSFLAENGSPGKKSTERKVVAQEPIVIPKMDILFHAAHEDAAEQNSLGPGPDEKALPTSIKNEKKLPDSPGPSAGARTLSPVSASAHKFLCDLSEAGGDEDHCGASAALPENFPRLARQIEQLGTQLTIATTITRTTGARDHPQHQPKIISIGNSDESKDGVVISGHDQKESSTEDELRLRERTDGCSGTLLRKKNKHLLANFIRKVVTLLHTRQEFTNVSSSATTVSAAPTAAATTEAGGGPKSLEDEIANLTVDLESSSSGDSSEEEEFESMSQAKKKGWKNINFWALPQYCWSQKSFSSGTIYCVLVVLGLFFLVVCYFSKNFKKRGGRSMSSAADNIIRTALTENLPWDPPATTVGAVFAGPDAGAAHLGAPCVNGKSQRQRGEFSNTGPSNCKNSLVHDSNTVKRSYRRNTVKCFGNVTMCPEKKGHDVHEKNLAVRTNKKNRGRNQTINRGRGTTIIFVDKKQAETGPRPPVHESAKHSGHGDASQRNIHHPRFPRIPGGCGRSSERPYQIGQRYHNKQASVDFKEAKDRSSENDRANRHEPQDFSKQWSLMKNGRLTRDQSQNGTPHKAFRGGPDLPKEEKDVYSTGERCVPPSAPLTAQILQNLDNSRAVGSSFSSSGGHQDSVDKNARREGGFSQTRGRATERSRNNTRRSNSLDTGSSANSQTESSSGTEESATQGSSSSSNRNSSRSDSEVDSVSSSSQESGCSQEE